MVDLHVSIPSGLRLLVLVRLVEMIVVFVGRSAEVVVVGNYNLPALLGCRNRAVLTYCNSMLSSLLYQTLVRINRVDMVKSART